MSKSLQLRANYKASICKLKTMLPDGAESLNGDIEYGDIMKHLHRRRIQNELTNLRTACDFLGIGRGETIPGKWLEELTDTEQQVFLKYFERRKRYSEIASLLGLEQMEVQKLYQSSLQKVMKKAGRD